MKYSTWLGIFAAASFAISGFIPWAFYPDIDKIFTGFYSQGNAYGKPGVVFIFLSVVSTVLFLIPKIWAKRANMLMTALAIAYSIKCYVLFSTCYRGICPEKKAGIYLFIVSSVIMLVAALLPDIKLKEKSGQG